MDATIISSARLKCGICRRKLDKKDFAGNIPQSAEPLIIKHHFLDIITAKDRKTADSHPHEFHESCILFALPSNRYLCPIDNCPVTHIAERSVESLEYDTMIVKTQKILTEFFGKPFPLIDQTLDFSDNDLFQSNLKILEKLQDENDPRVGLSSLRQISQFFSNDRQRVIRSLAKAILTLNDPKKFQIVFTIPSLMRAIDSKGFLFFQNDVGAALIQAADLNELNIIKFLIKRETTPFPEVSSSDLRQAILVANKKGHKEAFSALGGWFVYYGRSKTAEKVTRFVFFMLPLIAPLIFCVLTTWQTLLYHQYKKLHT